MKSPYSQYRGPGTFSRDLASVQEKAELLQEKLYSLEHLHQKQSKELESFKSSKQHLEVMFQEKWDKLELQKTETEEQVVLYRKLLSEEREGAGKVQGQLENKVKSLQNQLENQKQQLTTQHDVMYELQGVICTIQQKQNEERSRLCVIQWRNYGTFSFLKYSDCGQWWDSMLRYWTLGPDSEVYWVFTGLTLSFNFYMFVMF